MSRTTIEPIKLLRKCFYRNYGVNNTVDASEIEHFQKFSQDWWNEFGLFKPLHSMNKLRVPLIRDGILNTNKAQGIRNSPRPLEGISILDVGCGGGILTEPLAKIGGQVTGLDPNAKLLENAQSHSNLKNLKYVCSTIEDHAGSNIEGYDAVVTSEVIEHISHKQEFVKFCLQCLKPGGSFFVTTLNKSWFASLAVIQFGENILKIVPEGTHEHDKFIRPQDLQKMVEDENCKTVLIHGTRYNFITNQWSWSSVADIGYCLHAVKLKNI